MPHLPGCWVGAPVSDQDPKQPPIVRYVWEAYGAGVEPVWPLEATWVRDEHIGRELAFLDMAIRQFESWLPARRRRVLDYLNARYPREEP